MPVHEAHERSDVGQLRERQQCADVLALVDAVALHHQLALDAERRLHDHQVRTACTARHRDLVVVDVLEHQVGTLDVAVVESIEQLVDELPDSVADDGLARGCHVGNHEESDDGRSQDQERWAREDLTGVGSDPVGSDAVDDEHHRDHDAHDERDVEQDEPTEISSLVEVHLVSFQFVAKWPTGEGDCEQQVVIYYITLMQINQCATPCVVE